MKMKFMVQVEVVTQCNFNIVVTKGIATSFMFARHLYAEAVVHLLTLAIS